MKAGYKQTEVGVIPEDWGVHQLGDLKPFVTSGSRGWADYYSSRGDLFVRITNLSRQSIYLDLMDCRFVRLPEGNSEGVRTQLREGDVLVSITADIGIVGYVDDRVPSPAYINQHIALVRFDALRVDGKFISYFLASAGPQRVFLASTDTGAKAGMSLAGVQKIQTALPPRPEQSAIATALSDVDALLAAQDALIAKKRAIKQGAMQELLTGKRRLPGFSGEWATCRIADIAQIKTGPFGSALHESDYVQIGTPIITVEHLGEFGVTRQNLPLVSNEDRKRLQAYSLEVGDIVFSRVGSVDRNALIRDDESGWLFSGRLLRVRLFKTSAFPAFVSFQFNTDNFRNSVLAVAVGQTMASLNTKILRNLKVTLPPIAEQVAIAAALSDMDTELTALEAQRAKTAQLKQGMMQALLTGRIRLV